MSHWIVVFLIFTLMKCQSQPVCPVRRKYGIENTLDCEGKDISRVPPTLPQYNISFIDLSRCKKLLLFTEDFSRWPYVVRLDLSEITMDEQSGAIPLDIFGRMGRLLEFHFTSSKLTDLDMWELPQKILLIDISVNEYQNFDFSKYDELLVLNLSYNNVSSFPNFKNPLVIEEMYMEGNPLDSLSYKDLIPCCNLKILQLDIPPNSSLLTSSSKCQCRQIRSWLQVFNITYGSLNCAIFPLTYFLDCDLSFADAKKSRTKCDDDGLLPIPIYLFWEVFVILFFSSLLILFLLLLGYVAYRKIIVETDEKYGKGEIEDQTTEEDANVVEEETKE